MGVINITPNSFSDGGLHLDKPQLLHTFDNFLKIPGLIIDVGFESTAPMNNPISALTEKERFNFFLSFLQENPTLPLSSLSIDTYKTENFTYFYQEIKKLYPDIKIIWNDVSGVLDSDLERILQTYTDVDYIFTFTRIPDRTQVLEHMKFLLKTNNDLIQESFLSFKSAYQWFSERNLEKREIL